MNLGDISDTLKKYSPFLIVGGVAFLFTSTILAIVIPLGIGVAYYNKEKIPKIFSSKQTPKPFPPEEDEKKPEKKEQNTKLPQAEKEQNEREVVASKENENISEKRKIPPRNNLGHLSHQQGFAKNK